MKKQKKSADSILQALFSMTVVHHQSLSHPIRDDDASSGWDMGFIHGRLSSFGILNAMIDIHPYSFFLIKEIPTTLGPEFAATAAPIW